MDTIDDDDILVEDLCHLAKSNSDHLRRETKNKVWTAHWCGRMAHATNQLRSWLDSPHGVHSLSKLFLVHCETKMPLSEGVAFLDFYLNTNWEIGDKGPDNNCYFLLDYNYAVDDSMLESGKTVEYYRDHLNKFLRSLHWQNDSVFFVKLMQYHLAFHRIPTGVMTYAISEAGKGKGMESVLERHLFGERNSTTLDCGVFLDRTEFRKSAGCAWNCANVRLNEIDCNTKFLSDIWKRFVVDEEIDVRVNYGFTVKRKFGRSMKVQDLNYENIPVIEVALPVLFFNYGVGCSCCW